jgi:hypothetical protein
MTVAELIAQKDSLPSERIVLTGYLAIRFGSFDTRVYEKQDGPYIDDAVFVTVSDERVKRAVFRKVPPYGGGLHSYFDRAELDAVAKVCDSGICLSSVDRVVIFRPDKDWHVETTEHNAA